MNIFFIKIKIMKNKIKFLDNHRPRFATPNMRSKFPNIDYLTLLYCVYLNILMMYFNNISFVKSVATNFHVSLTPNSIFSKNFEKIKPLDFIYGTELSNVTIFAETINIDDSAIFKIQKFNSEILTSAFSIYSIKNNDFIVTDNDYLVEYIYPTSSILSQSLNPKFIIKQNEKLITCNYFINSPSVSYNWINVKSYSATAKYSFLTFVLKNNINGIFYLDYNSDENKLNEIIINSENYDLISEKYSKLWFIEQKYIDNDFMVLAKEKENDYELIFFKIKISNLKEKNLEINLNYYTKIKIKSNFYWQINKIAYYNEQFIIATKKSGLVVLHRFSNLSSNNETLSNVTNSDNYLINSDPFWTIKTTMNNFEFPRGKIQNVNTNQNFTSNISSIITESNKILSKEFQVERSLVKNLTSNVRVNINQIFNNSININEELENKIIINETTNMKKTENISLNYNNVLDMIINEFTMYIIIENAGLLIINLENFIILEEFSYENPYLYKLEFYNNIYLGNKFIGIYAENPETSSQDLFIELLIDQELKPLANKVFTSKNYIGLGKAETYDDFLTFIMNSNEKKLMLIRKGMINYIPFLTHIIDMSYYIKFDLQNTNFISLYDSSKNKIIYSLYTLDLIIPFNITFTDEYVNCKFSQPGKYEINFLQKSELCYEGINSNSAISFCERYIKYVIEVVGPPSADVQQLLTGILITFSLILIGLIIFFIIKSDGCKNIKYFKIIKTTHIRERLYYDAGHDINLESNMRREIMSERIINNNNSKINKIDEIDKNKENKKENIDRYSKDKTFRFVFNPDIKNKSNNSFQAEYLNENIKEEEEIKLNNEFEKINELMKEENEKDEIDNCKNSRVFDFKESVKDKLIITKVLHNNSEENIIEEEYRKKTSSIWENIKESSNLELKLKPKNINTTVISNQLLSNQIEDIVIKDKEKFNFIDNIVKKTEIVSEKSENSKNIKTFNSEE